MWVLSAWRPAWMPAVPEMRQKCVGDMELASGKFLRTSQVFLDSRERTDEAIDRAIEELLGKKAEVIVASEAFAWMIRREAAGDGTGGEERALYHWRS